MIEDKMSLSHMYRDQKVPVNHIAKYEKEIEQAKYGSELIDIIINVVLIFLFIKIVDSPIGMLLSFPFTPLYAYATMKGKFKVWDEILQTLSPEIYDGPTLDAGCGRGMVLIKIGKKKKQRLLQHLYRKQVESAFGIDIFPTLDQSGNHPTSTAANVYAEGLMKNVILNTANFLYLPFNNDKFSLVTSSLACE